MNRRRYRPCVISHGCSPRRQTRLSTLNPGVSCNDGSPTRPEPRPRCGVNFLVGCANAMRLTSIVSLDPYLEFCATDPHPLLCDLAWSPRNPGKLEVSLTNDRSRVPMLGYYIPHTMIIENTPRSVRIFSTQVPLQTNAALLPRTSPSSTIRSDQGGCTQWVVASKSALD